MNDLSEIVVPDGALPKRLVTLVWCAETPGSQQLDWLKGLAARARGPVYSVGEWRDSGLTALGRQRRDFDGALAAAGKLHPEHSVLLLRAGLEPPQPLPVFERIVNTENRPDRLVFPGNHDDQFNPFIGWPQDVRIEQPARLVHWCGRARWQWIWVDRPDCLLVAPGAVAEAPLGGGNAAGGPPAALIDDTFVLDPARELLPGSGVKAVDAVATVLGQLRLRLRHLALSDPAPAANTDPDAPVTLHIAHDWGGGVWRWIEDFIAGDRAGANLVLVSDSDRSGDICGRGLKLFVGAVEHGLVREIPLSPEIVSTVGQHQQYRRALDGLIERFGVSRIVVSSLIGHSLDCLSTGLPTVQVLHDFYPVWPLLDFDPLPFIDKKRGVNRTRALARHGDTLRVRPRDAGFWKRIADSWRRTVDAHEVKLVAPTDHVIERWQALNPGTKLEISKIPHAFRAFSDRKTILPPDPDAPLHLVIPGRLTPGKGIALLEKALPELCRQARITALGCGREAFKFFGHAGIDLIVNYRHEEFPALIRTLRPHAALFLSTVPETWNYALSEVRAVGLVPIATRIGSFPERIRDGEDGLLFDPEPGALTELVGRLARKPEKLAELAARKPRRQTPRQLVARFDRIAAPGGGSEPGHHRQMGEQALALGRVAAHMVELEVRHSVLRSRIEELDDELGRRTRWAEKLDRQFRERSAWIESLQGDLDSARQAYAKLQQEFDERTEWARSLDRELAETRQRMSALQHEFDRRTDWALQLQREKQELEQVLGREIERIRTDFEREQQLRRELEGDLESARHTIDQRELELAETSGRLEDLAQRHDALELQFDQIIHSRSWRLTRPMRVAARVARNARSRGVFNPLRWPRLLGRLAHHLRLRGLWQTLTLMQLPPPQAEAIDRPVQLPVPEVGEIAAPVHHQRPDAPEVSVIVPLYNQLHYTSACLESLLAVQTALPFEIIVVDDASSDGTREWLKQCRGIKYLRNRRNLGFIGSCNKGAKKAAGRWLVFLNNDTRVTDGWLDALIGTFAEHPEAGIVGGKLIFGDGTLQEAGGIIFADGSGWNYGRGDDPQQPEYGFVSEADYVSGACLAIARERFLALGGFDRHYAPAYYEDTDLCFKVRDCGLKVCYQPAATVIHYEGGTSGTDESAGIKQHQATNREKFRERWRGVLAGYPDGYPDNPQQHTKPLAVQHRYRHLPRRALVIDATTPMPDHDSGSVRMFALLKLLGELGYRTGFMPQNLARVSRHSAALEQAGIEVLTVPWITDPEDWLAEHGSSLDLVLVSRHYVLAPLIKMIRAYCPNARLVFDTVDLHFLREQREAELAGSDSARKLAEKTRAGELGLIGESDATLVVSEFEKQLLADLVPDADVRVVSNIHSLRNPGKPFEQRRDLVFVGGFQHPPNIDAADWLIGEILPRVREQLPEVSLHLIGSRMPERIALHRAPGLRVHGFVENLEPFMTGCRISVAPLRYGAGVKGKVNQAMSHGLPVVATTCAAEGMYAEHEVDILVADDAESFAFEVVRLYRDSELWQRLATNGRANVERHFSVAAARRVLEELLD